MKNYKNIIKHLFQILNCLTQLIEVCLSHDRAIRDGSQANVLLEALFEELTELRLLAFVLGGNQLADLLGAAEEASGDWLVLVGLDLRVQVLGARRLLLERPQEMHLSLGIHDPYDHRRVAQKLDDVLLFVGPEHCQRVGAGLELLDHLSVDTAFVDRQGEHSRAHVVLMG